MREIEIVHKVDEHFTKLGYKLSTMSHDVKIGYERRVDLVVYDEDEPYVVAEITNTKNLPNTRKETDLQFHPVVRKTQSSANDLDAPYYLLTDGVEFFWFTTDDMGRPQLLHRPVYPTKPSVDDHSRGSLIRIFQELRSHFLRLATTNISDEAAIVVYAKLLAERGRSELKETLINSRQEEELLRKLNLPELLPRVETDPKYYLKAFSILDRVELLRTQPQDLLYALDEVFISGQKSSTVRLPRWLTDFMLRLGNVHKDDSILDIYSGFGDSIAVDLFNRSRTNLWVICPNSRAALWARIQQVVFGKGNVNILIGEVPPYSVLTSKSSPEPTLVVVAPPFNLKVPGNSSLQLNSSKIGTSDEIYLELAIHWARPRGRIIALVPERILFAESSKKLRRFLLNEVNLTAIISLGKYLPDSSIKTSILILDKANSNVGEDKRVFLASIPSLETENTLDSREIEICRDILETLSSWRDGEPISKTPKIGEVTHAELDIGNLTVTKHLSKYSADSGSDEVPFPMVPLLEVINDIRRGSTLTLEDNGNLPVIGPKSIRPMELDKYSLDLTVQSKLTSSPTFAEAGDVVINAISTYRGAAAVVAQELDDTLVSRNVIVLTPDPTVVASEYLAAAINSEYVKTQIDEITTGSVIPAISIRLLKDIAVPLPDLETQRRIMDQITSSFEHVQKARKHLEKVESRYTRILRYLIAKGETK